LQIKQVAKGSEPLREDPFGQLSSLCSVEPHRKQIWLADWFFGQLAELCPFSRQLKQIRFFSFLDFCFDSLRSRAIFVYFSLRSSFVIFTLFAFFFFVFVFSEGIELREVLPPFFAAISNFCAFFFAFDMRRRSVFDSSPELVAELIGRKGITNCWWWMGSDQSKEFKT